MNGEWRMPSYAIYRLSFQPSLDNTPINVWLRYQGKILEYGGVSRLRAGTVNNGIGSGQWPVAESSTAMVSVAEAPLIPLTLILLIIINHNT